MTSASCEKAVSTVLWLNFAPDPRQDHAERFSYLHECHSRNEPFHDNHMKPENPKWCGCDITLLTIVGHVFSRKRKRKYKQHVSMGKHSFITFSASHLQTFHHHILSVAPANIPSSHSQRCTCKHPIITFSALHLQTSDHHILSVAPANIPSSHSQCCTCKHSIWLPLHDLILPHMYLSPFLSTTDDNTWTLSAFIWLLFPTCTFHLSCLQLMITPELFLPSSDCCSPHVPFTFLVYNWW